MAFGCNFSGLFSKNTVLINPISSISLHSALPALTVPAIMQTVYPPLKRGNSSSFSCDSVPLHALKLCTRKFARWRTGVSKLPRGRESIYIALFFSYISASSLKSSENLSSPLHKVPSSTNHLSSSKLSFSCLSIFSFTLALSITKSLSNS